MYETYFSLYMSSNLTKSTKRAKIIAMNTFNFMIKTPYEINLLLAKRIRTIRRARKISQKRLSEKSGVSLASVKRFEQSGEISLLSLTKIAIALDLNQEMEGLFAEPHPQSIEELL